MPEAENIGVPAQQARKSFMRSPSRVYPLAFFAAYVALAVFYYYWIVPQRQEAITDQAFRMLATVSDQIRSKIESYTTIILAQKIRDHESGRRVITPNDVANLNRQNLTPEFEFVSCNGRYRPDQKAPQSVEQKIVLRIEPEQGSFYFLLEYEDGPYALCAHAQVARVAEPFLRLLPEETFADVALATGEGETLYQLQRTGIRLANIGPLLSSIPTKPANASPAMVIQVVDAPKIGLGGQSVTPTGNGAGLKPKEIIETTFSRVLDWKLADQSYKLLVQPVVLPVAPPSIASSSRVAHLALLGIVDSGRLSARARTLPYDLLINITGIVILCLFALWPVLKLAKTGPAERFRPAEILALALLMVGATLIITTLILYDTKVLDKATMDWRLEALADRIDLNLQRELDFCLATMQGLSHTAKLEELRRKSTGWDHIPDLLNETKNPEGARIAHRFYPWLDQVFWTDETGAQLVKWTAYTTATRKTSISQFPWFINLQRGQTSRLVQGSISAWPVVASDKLVFDSVYSPNTGEYFSLVLQVVEGLEPLKVAAMVFPSIALIGPVLPPHYGFAILDEVGTVRFHSDPDKNLRENLLREVAPEGELRSALYSQSGRKFDVRYQGRDYRMYARPFRLLQNTSWSIVVFHDLSARQRFYLDVLIYTVLCNLAYFLIIGTCVVTAVFVLRRGKNNRSEVTTIWYRPDREHLPALLMLIGLYGVLLLIFATMGSRHASAIWMAVLLIPIATLGWTVALFRWPQFWKRGTDVSSGETAPLLRIPHTSVRGSRVIAAHVFGVATTMLLILVAVLPAIAFYKLSFDHCRISYVKDQQIKLARDLKGRSNRVKAYYRRVNTDRFSGRYRDDAAFLTQRLSQMQLDRYDLSWSNVPYELLGTSAGEVQSGSCSPGEDPVLCKMGQWLVDLAPHPHSSTHREIESGRWRWDIPFKDRLRMSESESAINVLEQWEKYLPITSELPPYPRPNKQGLIWIGMLIASSWLVVAYTLFHRFGLRHKPPDAWPKADLQDEARYFSRNTLVIGMPRRIKLEFSHEGKYQCWTLKELLEAMERKPDPLRWQPLVVIDNFEYGIDNPLRRQRTLELLEQLLRNPHYSILILTTVNPIYFLFEDYWDPSPKNDAERPRDLDEYSRWMNALNSFGRQLAPYPASDEHWTEEDWHLIWAECAPREKLALWQLANDGVVNPKNAFALDHLYLRGLVTCNQDRVFRILYQPFCKFLQRELARKQVEVYFGLKAETAWGGMKRALLYTAMALPLFLVFAWADLAEAGIGKIITLGSAGTGAWQLLGRAMEMAGPFRKGKKV